eukprot:1174271-Pyramimonas_sp.AAC.1
MHLDPDGSRPARRDRTLTPAEFRGPPAEAHTELRRLYTYLEKTYAIPEGDLTDLIQAVDWLGSLRGLRVLPRQWNEAK